MNTYEQLDAWIDAHFDEQVRFLQELIRVPTDTPPGNNAPHADRAADLLRAMGLDVEKHPVPEAEVRAAGLESITNLVVRRRYGPGKSVLLNAHGDVVPPGEGWTHDPYGGEIADGKIYGRAAAVSKCDFSTYAFAVRALEAVVQPKITQAFSQIKQFMDPENLLSPQRIVNPPKMDDTGLMRFPPGYKVIPLQPVLDWSAWNVQNNPATEAISAPGSGGDPAQGFAKAVEMCNNNGHCRKFDAGTMCPSYRVTRDEQHLTRGRANTCLLYTSPSPRDRTRSRMPSSA